jgi:TolB-like protein
MVTLFDNFVMWFNGLFGLEYAGYGWITAIVVGFVTVVLAYFVVKLAIRPLIPLFGAEHSKIGSERPSIDKGLREAHRSNDSLVTSYETDEELTPEPDPKFEPPFIQILPLEDFNHICPEASKLAGHLADGLALTLQEIPQVNVERSKLDTMRPSGPNEEAKFVVSGSVKTREDDIAVCAMVRDTRSGEQIWTQSQICQTAKLPALERELAVEIASVVLQHHRSPQQAAKPVSLRTKTTAQSGSTYPNGRLPLPAGPRKTDRRAM